MFKTERKIYLFNRSSQKETTQKSDKLRPQLSIQYCLMYCSNSHDVLYDCTLLSGLVILLATIRKIIYSFKQWQSGKSLGSFYNFSPIHLSFCASFLKPQKHQRMEKSVSNSSFVILSISFIIKYKLTLNMVRQ